MCWLVTKPRPIIESFRRKRDDFRFLADLFSRQIPPPSQCFRYQRRELCPSGHKKTYRSKFYYCAFPRRIFYSLSHSSSNIWRRRRPHSPRAHKQNNRRIVTHICSVYEWANYVHTKRIQCVYGIIITIFVYEQRRKSFRSRRKRTRTHTQQQQQ